MFRKGMLFVLLVVMVTAAHATDWTSGYAIGVRPVSSMGPGIEVTKSVNSSFAVRLALNGLAFRYEGESAEHEAAYDVNLKLQSWGGYVDWHPWDKGFRVTGGLLVNNNTVATTVRPTSDFTMGGLTYTPEESGNISSRVSYDRFAPYLGIGFGHTAPTHKRWGFTLDLGVWVTGSPNVSMRATGLVSPTAQEAADIEDNLSGIKVWGVLSLGMTFRVI